MDGTGFAQVIPAATPPPRRGADATTALVPEVGSAYRVRGVLHFFREQVRSTLRCKRQLAGLKVFVPLNRFWVCRSLWCPRTLRRWV
eukprot:COSAG04_NODE_304_length_17311_cov_13.648792_13_plen_87_part_00